MKLLFIGAHLGYSLDKVPLGGGAAVGERLVHEWSRRGDFYVAAIGAGRKPPVAGMRYVQVASELPQTQEGPDLTAFSERQYARFCRRFEAAATAAALREIDSWGGERGLVVVNDIAESPDLAALAARAPLATVWHVDVVDYFAKMYLGGVVSPKRLVGVYDRIERFGGGRAVPDLLRLVFDKQRRAVLHSTRLVVPSAPMREMLLDCYPARKGLAADIVVRPWGGWEPAVDRAAVEREVARLRRTCRVAPDRPVVMTLSRLSPEKGLESLLDALAEIERRGGAPAPTVFLCGEAAYMRGRRTLRRLRLRAARLRETTVHFPGHVSGPTKAALFELADLFVSPSVHESYGLTLAEAIRAGLPVLAGDHYGARELVEPSFGEVAAPAEFAAALARLLARPRELARMGARAKEAGRALSFETAASALASEFKKVLESQR